MENIKIIKSNKFKTITIKVVLYNKFNKENATGLSLLSRVLTNTTKKYNTKRKMINKLCNLYDASVYTGTNPSHEVSINTFTMTIVNDKIINDSKFVFEGIKFLYEMIKNPNVENNAFNEEVFNEEKRILKDEIIKIYNNKNRYALRQAIKHMCPNESVSISSLGTLEELEKITPESLYVLYKDLIENSNVYIYAMGDVDDSFKEKLSIFNGIKSCNIELNPVVTETIIPTEVKYITEKQDLKQAKLVMGFRTGCNYKDVEYYELQLFSLMYGGLFCSNLFQEVREKHNYAYDIASFLVPDSKVMIVSCGVDSENIDATIEIINNELKKYQDGDIDEELLEIAKTNAISDLNEIEDSPNAYINTLTKQVLLDQNYSIEDVQDIVRGISKENIIKQAQNIYLDTVFVLTNK